MGPRSATASALTVRLTVGIAVGIFLPASAAPALPDLVVLELRAPAAGVRIGRCNAFEVMVRNAGAATAVPTQLRLTLTRPGLAQAAVDARTLALAELGPGQQRIVTVSGLHVPEPGPWRIEAVADPAQTLVESNEGNNARVLEVANVPALCAPLVARSARRACSAAARRLASAGACAGPCARVRTRLDLAAYSQR